jgi:hypothetical protein
MGRGTLSSVRPARRAPSVGAWRSLVARIVRDDKVGGSNPLAPTKLSNFAFELHHGRQRGIESERDRVSALYEAPFEYVRTVVRPVRLSIAVNHLEVVAA